MVRAFFVALALALGVNAEPVSPPPQPATDVPDGVLAILYQETGPGSELARVDPLTLEPLGRRLDLGPGAGWTTAFSPDYGTLAIAGGQGFATVELVDVRRMRSLAIIDLETSGTVSFLMWHGRSLFAVVDDQGKATVLAIDPIGHGVAARHRMEGNILQVKRGIGQVVLLLAPRDRIGPLRLAVVGGKGMASTSIPGFVGGWKTERDGQDVLTRQRIPALVVDEVGRRAVVVAGAAVAEISLRNLSVSRHAMSEPISLLERFRNWLEPPAYAKLVEGSSRTGAWVGEGVFALTGVDYSVDDGAEPTPVGKPAGLALVDTGTWSVRMLNKEAADLVVTEHALLTYSFDGEDGVRGYDLGGAERFHLLPHAPVFWLQVVGGLVYAHLDSGKRVAVIDPAVGRVVGRATTEQPLTLVEG